MEMLLRCRRETRHRRPSGGAAADRWDVSALTTKKNWAQPKAWALIFYATTFILKGLP